MNVRQPLRMVIDYADHIADKSGRYQIIERQVVMTTVYNNGTTETRVKTTGYFVHGTPFDTLPDAKNYAISLRQEAA